MDGIGAVSNALACPHSEDPNETSALAPEGLLA